MVSSTVAHGEVAAVAADLLATSDRTSAHRSGEGLGDLHGTSHPCCLSVHHPQRHLQSTVLLQSGKQRSAEPGPICIWRCKVTEFD